MSEKILLHSRIRCWTRALLTTRAQFGLSFRRQPGSRATMVNNLAKNKSIHILKAAEEGGYGVPGVVSVVALLVSLDPDP